MRLPSKPFGPLKSSSRRSGNVVLACDSSYRWPIVLGVVGVISTGLLVWHPSLYVLLWPGPVLLLAGISFAFQRPHVVLSSEHQSMSLLHRSWLPWKWRTQSTVPFGDLREFVVEPEFELGGGDSFVWHLFAINRDGRQIPMAWHFRREPVWEAAIHAAEVSGKPVREQPDATQSEKWKTWGANFM